MNSKISCAVAAVLAGGSCAVSSVAQAADDPTVASTDTNTEGLTEITVTAQRRSQNMQDVPISMQAFTAQTLQQLNVGTFDDYIKYLPNVTTANNGPGQNEIFMRGLSAGSQPSQGSGSTGLFPNVAIYLDNQSGQLPNRNLDIYAADLNRIEVLEGPQGTLFGAGAEAGVIRYITNEPKLDVTEVNVKAGYGTTAHGDPNSNLEAVLNVPLIADTLAVRGVVYSDRRGGYINNVPGTFTRSPNDIGIHYAAFPAGCGANSVPPGPACQVPPNSPSLNNAALVGNAINPVTYGGARVELLYKINDDWNALISQSYQDMDSQGVFYQQPNASDGQALQPLEVTLFNPSYDKDRFESTAWTLNGKFGVLKAVYTGGYLVRNVEQVGDYTNYSRGVYADYYQCYGPTYYHQNLKATCYSPSAYWRSTERNVHQQHEFRLSTPDDWRLRAIGGAFWESNTLYDQTGWNYKTVPSCTPTTPAADGCFANIGTIPGSSVTNPGIQGDNTSFYQDTQRKTKQTAVFASLDFDIIPKVLTITAGTRYFRFQNYSAGSVLSSFGCFQGALTADGCHVTQTATNSPYYYSYNLNAAGLSDTESGFKSRANLTWHITRDAMVYYTFSQGFRPGGFNQNGGSPHAFTPGVAPTDPSAPQYFIPKSYSSDKLANNEIGWKTEFWDNRLQWNGAVYREDWDDVQVAFFDPTVVGNIFYNTNGQDFLIEGVENSLIARVTNGLTVQGAMSYTFTNRQTNSPLLLNNNPASPGFGTPITTACNSYGANCLPVTNPYGPAGAPSANAPKIQYSLRARYEWDVAGYAPFVQVAGSHTGSSFTQAGANPTIGAGSISTGRLRFENPAYTTYDASIGVSKDAWYFTIFGQNLANSNASTFVSTDQFIVAQTPLRPRVLGGEFGYKF